MANHRLAQQTVLPSPQKQNMPNCVSEYAKQCENMPIFFVTKKTTEKLAVKFFTLL